MPWALEVMQFQCYFQNKNIKFSVKSYLKQFINQHDYCHGKLVCRLDPF